MRGGIFRAVFSALLFVSVFVVRPVPSSAADAGTADLVSSWFAAVVSGDAEKAPLAALFSGLGEREILETAFLVGMARPLSRWRFIHGELVEIRAYPDKYVLSYSLPKTPPAWTADTESEWLHLKDAEKMSRKYVVETRELPRATDGRMPAESARGVFGAALAALDGVKSWKSAPEKVKDLALSAARDSRFVEMRFARDVIKAFEK